MNIPDIEAGTCPCCGTKGPKACKGGGGCRRCVARCPHAAHSDGCPGPGPFHELNRAYPWNHEGKQREMGW